MKYETTDLPTAAYLAARGHPAKVKPTAGPKVLFCFERTEEFDEDLSNISSAKISPAAYEFARRALLSEVRRLPGRA